VQGVVSSAGIQKLEIFIMPKKLRNFASILEIS
jgi:hypothetical protein